MKLLMKLFTFISNVGFHAHKRESNYFLKILQPEGFYMAGCTAGFILPFAFRHG